MPRRILSNSFVSGEISPELYGRHDLKAYFNGAATLDNFIVRRTGGIRKRAGTEVMLTLNAALGADSGTLSNRFKVFSYYYDTSIFGLLIFRLTTAGVVQSKLVIRENEANTVGTWTDLPIFTGITTADDFDDLQAKQVGDTFFFTRLGHQAFTCKITKDTGTTEFTMLENAVTVPVPAAITATPDNFFAVNNTAGIQNITKYYALYGVKDGILSKPSTATALARTPWSSGATITVTGSLDFSVHDYYILAKKVGMNYGKISEIYPVEQTSNVAATNVSNDMAYRDSGGGVFNDSPASLFGGIQDLKALSKPVRSMSPVSSGYKSSEPVAGTYRIVSPHYEVSFGTSGTKYARLLFNTDAVKCDSTLAVTAMKLSSLTATITPFEYEVSGDTITLGTPVTATSNPSGAFTGINIGTRSGNKIIGFFIDSDDARLADGAFLAAVSISTSSTFSTGHIQSTGANNAIWPGSPADNFLNDTYRPAPTLFVKVSGSVFTSAWQDRDPFSTYCNTSATWTSRYNKVQQSCTLNQALDFHIAGAKLSQIEFTVPTANKLLSSITLHIGADVLNGTTAAKVTETQQYVVAKLETIDGATEATVDTYNVYAGTFASQKLSITYPDTAPAQKTYRITFTIDGVATPIHVRGITINGVNSVLEFIDDNVLPGAVTGQQDMLAVGDSNMDCAVFDVFEQRSVYAASNELPFTLWFSVVGDLYNFYTFRPQADDDAFSVTLPAKKASRILHIVADKELLLFTEDGVYVCDAENGAGFSYRTIRIRKICGAASSPDVRPIKVDGQTLFVGQDGRTVYELKYDLMADAIQPSDKSVLAYHLTETSRIVKMAYQRFPDSVIWFLLDDGSLRSMTYMPEQEVWGWSRHTMAANASRQKIIDIIEVGSVRTGSQIETTSDILLVFETYDAQGNRDSKTIVERLRPNTCADDLTLADANNECTDHLGGTYPADVTATLVTLRPESPEVSTQGVPKRVVDVCLRLRRSGKVSVRANDALLPAQSNNPAVEDNTNHLLKLYSGDLKIMPNGYINGDGQLVIMSADASPCEILSAVYTMDTP